MFKKVLLLFCLALSFITFSCSKDKEPDQTPHISALSESVWEGTHEVYEGNQYICTNSAILSFGLDNHMKYVIFDDQHQVTHEYEYATGNRVIKMGTCEYYALEASKDAMVLQGFDGKYKIILRLHRK